jgi:AcrR family transcriptional regulator
MPDDQTGEARSPEKPLGRRERKALAVHRALLDAGFALFGRRPIAMVSVLDITEKADVAKGVFYLHFKSKDEFLIALWEDLRESLLVALRHALHGVRSPRTRVEGAARHYRRFAENRPDAVRFWIRMSGYLPEEVGRPGQLTHLRRGWLEQLGALLADVDGGDPVPPPLRRTAELVDAWCWAMIAQAILLETDPPDEDHFARVVVRAAQAPEPPQG